MCGRVRRRRGVRAVTSSLPPSPPARPPRQRRRGSDDGGQGPVRVRRADMAGGPLRPAPSATPQAARAQGPRVACAAGGARAVAHGEHDSLHGAAAFCSCKGAKYADDDPRVA
jgi:hypothetical protein